MTKRLTMVFCLLWCLFLIHFTFAQWNMDEKTMEAAKVFNKLNFESTAVRIEMTGELGRVSTDRKAMESLEHAVSILGMPEEIKIVEDKKHNGTIWTAEGGNEYRIRVCLIGVEDGFFMRYYLQAEAVGAVVPKQIAALQSQMEQIRQVEKMECPVSIRLEGHWNRLLNETEKKKAAEYFLQETGAEMTETISEGNLMMIYAYSEELDESVKIGSHQINLNLIFRESDGETLCFAGIPAVWYDDVTEEY